MEIRLDGKHHNSPGYKNMGAWIRTTKDQRKVLILSLGEVKISVYPYDRNTVNELGKKLQEIIDM